MRKMKVKSPEKETATTTREEDQESSLRGVPSVGRYKEITERTNYKGSVEEAEDEQVKMERGASQ